ncbi:MAG: formate dehydrogenase accessory sulfurtransferase FdhD [Phycisphaerales bacterium]
MSGSGRLVDARDAVRLGRRPGEDEAGKGPADVNGPDLVAVERPLVVDLDHGPAEGRTRTRLMSTLRTPGHDAELILGWCLAEGVIAAPSAIAAITGCGDAPDDGDVVRVTLHPDVAPDLERARRLHAVSAACGACGRTSFAAPAVNAAGPAKSADDAWSVDVLVGGSDRLREAQPGFRATGGLHAAGWMTHDGALHHVREDVGRHNALDKLIGALAAAASDSPGQAAAESTAAAASLPPGLVVMSSRAGSELVEKIIACDLPGLVTVGAVTDRAVDLAKSASRILIGFSRSGRLTVYAGAHRVRDCGHGATETP